MDDFREAAPSAFQALAKELNSINAGLSVADFFRFLQSRWVEENVGGSDAAFAGRVLERPASELVERSAGGYAGQRLDELAKQKRLEWGEAFFHLKYRATSYGDLRAAVRGIEPALEGVMKDGYTLSLMPIALASGNADLLSKFIPRKDFFTDHIAKSWDPYGIFGDEARITREGRYIGSRKFKASVLMNITSACPIGCVGCYKGFYTRIAGQKFYTDLENAVYRQSELLVQHLNDDPEAKTVIISGGEPLLLGNEGVKKILEELKDAKHLQELRICTGTIFQGLPFRIDDGLLGLLSEFENETGIKVHFNAHLSHPAQFTPESLMAVRKIVRTGFHINAQVPLQRGVNVFIEDFGKTLAVLNELARLQGASGVRPYKYILHMNVGSLEYSVPLEFMLGVLGELKYRLDHPLPETWQPVSVSILCREGNILLSPQMLYCMEKDVRAERNCVAYKIPVPVGEGRWRTVEYVEPLLKGFNDDPDSLKKFRP